MRWGGPFFFATGYSDNIVELSVSAAIIAKFRCFFFVAGPATSRATLYTDRQTFPHSALYYIITRRTIMYTITLYYLPITDCARGLTVETIIAV